MNNQNAQKYKINDRVHVNEQLYKIVYIYDDSSFKLKSVKSKINETIFEVPIEFVRKVSDNKYESREHQSKTYNSYPC